MAAISIRNLVKRYGNFTVIPDLNLEIADHEFVVFVGPSGCGKSTLLRIIAGLEPITSGDLYIGDKRVNAIPAAQRDIAMVFQDYALYPHMRVYDNMAFALELRGMSKRDIDARVRQAAAMLHIDAYLDRKPKELSGGQRQRVAMGRAIVRNPQVFLFDEPLSNLDAKLRAQVRAEIKSLSQQLRTTMVFVTHDQIEAMTMADRIVVLQSGIVQQYDTPEVVYERPANQFVAGFIGSPTMNFLPVEVHLDIAAFSHDGSPAPLNAATRGRVKAAGGKGVLGVRPEHFDVVPDEASGIAIRIKLVEPLGSDTLIHFDVGGAAAIARVDPSLKPKLGERLSLLPKADKIHLFDTETGRVLP
jgi:multiple sugar transport system ATP-binding protein